MRRISTLLILLAIVLTCAACSPQTKQPAASTHPASTGEASTAAPEGTSQAIGSIDPDVSADITVFNWGDASDASVNTAAYGRFTAKYPNITVRDDFDEESATWADHVAKLLSLTAAGNPPDMVVSPAENATQLVGHDLMLPMTTTSITTPKY